jgi:hypothetical protein
LKYTGVFAPADSVSVMPLFEAAITLPVAIAVKVAVTALAVAVNVVLGKFKFAP